MKEQQKNPQSKELEPYKGGQNEIAESFLPKLVQSVYNSKKEEVAKFFPEFIDYVETAYNGLILEALNEQGIGVIYSFDTFDNQMAYQILKVQVEGEDRGFYLSLWYRNYKECILASLIHGVKWTRRKVESETNLARAKETAQALQKKIVQSQKIEREKKTT